MTKKLTHCRECGLHLAILVPSEHAGYCQTCVDGIGDADPCVDCGVLMDGTNASFQFDDGLACATCARPRIADAYADWCRCESECKGSLFDNKYAHIFSGRRRRFAKALHFLERGRNNEAAELINF